LVLVANPMFPAKTFAELLAWIKQNAGKLSYSSTLRQPVTLSRLSDERALRARPPALCRRRASGFQNDRPDRGHVQSALHRPSALPFLREGKLRAIAITAITLASMPDVPTLRSSLSEFTGSRLVRPVPARRHASALVESLLAAAKAAHADTDVRSKLDAQGFDMSARPGRNSRAKSANRASAGHA